MKKNMTAAEFMEILEKDEEYQKRSKEYENRMNEFKKELDINEEPIVLELREKGYNLKSVWDLVNTKSNYSKALPVLVAHLALEYHPRIKEGIARALGVSEAKPLAWKLLIEEYKKSKGV